MQELVLKHFLFIKEKQLVWKAELALAGDETHLANWEHLDTE